MESLLYDIGGVEETPSLLFVAEVDPHDAQRETFRDQRC